MHQRLGSIIKPYGLWPLRNGTSRETHLITKVHFFPNSHLPHRCFSGRNCNFLGGSKFAQSFLSSPLVLVLL
ncbi:hypothetical protein L1887_27688 [Cichorium endivia]|nr:hypothetical protein L1887_27688 [Cichorium endivia]